MEASGDSRVWTEAQVQRRIVEMGPWFHNFEVGGVITAPDHPLGSFLNEIWAQIEPYFPKDMRGATVLDIGCNAGFYAQRLRRRGADVLGIDHDERYLRQARFAAEVNGLDIEFRKLEAYDVDTLGRQFDYVLFMGVFYHLRYPLYALDKVASLPRERLIVQSMIRGAPGTLEVPDDGLIDDHARFEDPLYPSMYFIEHRYANDPTNWWVPNESGLEAMLRSAGLPIEAHPFREVWICGPQTPDPMG